MSVCLSVCEREVLFRHLAPGSAHINETKNSKGCCDFLLVCVFFRANCYDTYYIEMTTLRRLWQPPERTWASSERLHVEPADSAATGYGEGSMVRAQPRRGHRLRHRLVRITPVRRRDGNGGRCDLYDVNWPNVSVIITDIDRMDPRTGELQLEVERSGIWFVCREGVYMMTTDTEETAPCKQRTSSNPTPARTSISCKSRSIIRCRQCEGHSKIGFDDDWRHTLRLFYR